MKKKVLLLGSNGMLGSCVSKYLKLHPDEIDLCCIQIRFNHKNRIRFEEIIQKNNFDYIVNCIGAIPQKTNDFRVNWELPEFLAQQIRKTDTRVIHASTDCEFSGKIPKGKKYLCIDKPDATDPYGLSKIRGSEFFLTQDMRDNYKALIIRTSIIGLEPNDGKNGLLGWFLSNKDGDLVTGYTNKWWNGITTLQWAKFCYLMILYNDKVIYNGNSPGINIFQPTTEPITKYCLLNIINKVFHRDIHVAAGARPPTERKLLENNWGSKLDSIERQLLDLRYFYAYDNKLF